MGFDIIHADANTVTTVTTARKSDVDAVAQHCADLRAAGLDTTGHGDKLVASVPGWVINDWCTRKGITFREFMRTPKLAERFLSDPDNAAFRVWKGRL